MRSGCDVVGWTLDLEATIGLAGAVDDAIVASASVRALRAMTGAERDELARRQLTPRELARYHKLAAFSKRQLEWLAGRLAAKHSVAQLVARVPSEIEIVQQDDAGPPYVDDAGIYVGISHSFDVALGVAAPYAIGVDVELVRPLPAELVEYAFAANELDPLGSDDTAIVRLWTMKESFVKMLGLGVGSFDELRLISCEAGRSRWSTHGRVAKELGTRQPQCWADITSGYAIALTWSVTR